MSIRLRVDGRQVDIDDDGASLLEVLRERLGCRSVKDGCSPQGQCGCCTVLVDGEPRVACVTPARRVAGREVTTLDGLDAEVRQRWAEAFSAAGASQCGFCTPGIIVRLASLSLRKPEQPLTPSEVEGALVAHLCRCTGWRTIVEAAVAATGGPAPAAAAGEARRDLAAAARRAELEGRAVQRVDPAVALGEGGFAEDTAPADALVAVPDGSGGWAVDDTLRQARARAGQVQGRRTTIEASPPLDVPPGDWVLTLRTSWVEPAYLELDASWCRPGGQPASPLANGGAFGAKVASVAPAAARVLADRYGRAVRVVLAREDVVRLGPKRPPLAAGVAADGSGVVRVVATPGIAEAIHRVAPLLVVDEVNVLGPPTSAAIRGAGWVEAAVLLAGLRWRQRGQTPVIRSPDGAVASAAVAADGTLRVEVTCGSVLDETVLRSYAIGAAHQALGWVTSEGLAVDGEGIPLDLTIRSFGVLRARQTPPVEVRINPDPTAPPVNGSEAVLAAVAAAVWIDRGLAPDWPLDQRRTT